MPKLITGPPRSKKTFTAVNKWVHSSNQPSDDFSGDPCIIVSRTKENAVQTYQTIEEHVDGLEDVIVMFYFGVGEVCPSVDDGSDLQRQRILHHQNCEANRNPVKVDHESLMESLEEGRLVEESWNSLYEAGECPWAAQNAFLSKRDSFKNKILILTTYASLPVINDHHKDIFSESCILLDEARHYINHVPVEQISLGDGLRFEDIFDDYRREIESIDLSRYFGEKDRENVKASIEEYLDYLDTVLEYTIKAKELENKSGKPDEETQEEIDEKFEAGRRLSDLKPVEEWKISCETYYWLKKELESGESARFPAERLHDAYSKPDIDFPQRWIDEVDEELKSNEAIDSEGLRLYEFLSNAREVIENDHEVEFDLVENQSQEKSIKLYILSKSTVSNGDSDNITLEARPLLSKIQDKSSSLVLIDSTFFPEKFWNFFFGRKTQIERFTLQADYEFSIVVEDARYSILQTYRSQRDKNKLIRKVRGIQDELLEEGKTPVIFARNKDEHSLLSESGIENVYYSRGTQVEGTQVEGDYTINCGIPLQNIHSENYRKYDLARSNWLDNNQPDPEKIVGEYRDVKAYQELLQQSFRTVKEDQTSGTLWLNTSFDVLQEMKDYWPWLSKFKHVKMSKSKNKELLEKIEEASYILLSGEALEESLRKQKIREKVLEEVSDNPGQKKEEVCEKIREELGVRKNTVHDIINQLVESNDVSEEKKDTSKRGRPPLVLRPSQ